MPGFKVKNLAASPSKKSLMILVHVSMTEPSGDRRSENGYVQMGISGTEPLIMQTYRQKSELIQTWTGKLHGKCSFRHRIR